MGVRPRLGGQCSLAKRALRPIGEPPSHGGQPTAATAPAGDGLGVALFSVRNGYAITGLSFTSSYTLVDSDGTEFGQAWSLEAFMAANTATTTAAQSTVASWTNGTRSGRVGVIAVFLPDTQQQAAAATEEANAALGGLFDRRGNIAYSGTLLIARPNTINATAAAAIYQTSGMTVTETYYYSSRIDRVATIVGHWARTPRTALSKRHRGRPSGLFSCRCSAGSAWPWRRRALV